MDGRKCLAVRDYCRLLLLCPLMLAGCAKTGEPHPPVVLVPRPAVDLAVRQYSDKAMLTVSMPVENTNGSPITRLRQVEILRRIESDRSNSAPLTEAEFLNGAVPLFSVPAEKTTDYLADKILVLRDELSFPDRSVIYRQAFRYAVRFVNRKNRNGGLSNQVYLTPVPIPPPPANIAAEFAQEWIRIKWQPPAENVDGSKPARIAGYNIYRSEDPKKFPPVPLNQDLIANPEFEDRQFQFDKTYYYVVSIVASRENPRAESPPSTVLPVCPQDTFPPGVPQNLNVVVTNGIVLLLWVAPSDSDVAGYRVYRKEEGGAARQLLPPGLVTTLSYRDEKAEHGRKYEYYVTAVDTHGNESVAAESAVLVR